MGNEAELKSEVMYIMDHIIETAKRIHESRMRTPHAISRAITSIIDDSPLELVCTGYTLYYRHSPGRLIEIEVKVMRRFIQALSRKLGLERKYADTAFFQLLMVEWLKESSRVGERRVEERTLHVLGEK